MAEQSDETTPERPYRPWRLLVLLGWLLLVLVHDQRIPGVGLGFLGELAAVVTLMVLSWFAMSNRRPELIGIAVLVAVGVIGLAAGLTMTQRLAMIGVVMMLALAYVLWLLRHASLRLRLIVMSVFAGVVALELFLAGFESLIELATAT